MLYLCTEWFYFWTNISFILASCPRNSHHNRSAELPVIHRVKNETKRTAGKIPPQTSFVVQLRPVVGQQTPTPTPDGREVIHQKKERKRSTPRVSLPLKWKRSCSEERAALQSCGTDWSDLWHITPADSRPAAAHTPPRPRWVQPVSTSAGAPH